jgi:hypothetical protein
VGYLTNGIENSQHCMRALPLESETTAVAVRYFEESDAEVWERKRAKEINQRSFIVG